VLQCLDYKSYIDIYHERIKAFHVKDAEFNPTGRQGVYGGFQGWVDRAGRFRSLGDGQVDFKTIFSKLTQYDYSGWAVMEWECFTCHKIDEKNIGPAWRDVAAKYAGQGTAVKYLAHKIINGGSGVWGQVPMAAHPTLSEDDAETVAKYVLMLKK